VVCFFSQTGESGIVLEGTQIKVENDPVNLKYQHNQVLNHSYSDHRVTVSYLSESETCYSARLYGRIQINIQFSVRNVLSQLAALDMLHCIKEIFGAYHVRVVFSGHSDFLHP
jgi:hypothetical protein